MTTLSDNNCRTSGAQASRAAEIRQWLTDFAAAVRDVDYDRARAMFADDVISFGTFTPIARGRDALVAQQWKNIWNRTRGFTFVVPQTQIEICGEIAWAAAPWTSQGRDAQGNWFDRPGRCTLILRRDGRLESAAWLCVHSHFSLTPTAT